MVSYRIFYTKQAVKDAKKIKQAGLKDKVIELIEILKIDPFKPPYEKLLGDLSGANSRRINFRHRLVYQVLKKEKSVKIIRMWTHY
jgi:toxin YoeB